MKLISKWYRVCNIICAGLLLALLICQLLPYWTMPACTCTNEDGCIPAQTKMHNKLLDHPVGSGKKFNADIDPRLQINPECKACDVIDTNCEACWITPKWCKNLQAQYQAGTDPDKLLKTDKEWHVSIQQYTWLPTFESCKGVDNYFHNEYDNPEIGYEYMRKDMATMPVVVFFFALIGAYFGLFKSKSPLPSIFALVTGIVATYTYLTQHIFQLPFIYNQPWGFMWIVHLAISILIIVFSLVPTAEYIRRAVDWCNPKKAK